MVGVLTVATGYSVRYLTDEVAQGRENYYTGAVAEGEPPGRWYGAGAEAVGLTGLVDEQDMTAVYERFIDPRDPAFTDPSKWAEASTLGHTGRKYQSEEELYKLALDAEPDASPERREQLKLDAGKRARNNVAFLDATFSVQKSITVLHTAFEAQQVAAERVATAAETNGDTREAGRAREAAASWRTHRDAVEDAIWAGNRAALDYLSAKAGYSRIGHHGGAAGRYIDAHDWIVASFFQHDSRNHDPQLHIHNAILNRVQGSDGAWRTLDSRAIHKFRGAAAAVAERTMEEHLTRTLGVQFATRPDGKAREIVGVPAEVMDLFSSRRRAITRHTRELVDAFEERFGREPNALELDRLQRQATFATRKAKSHDGETVEERLDRWDRDLRAEVAGGLAEVAQTVLDHRADCPGEEWSPRAVIETALAAVQEKKAAWTAPDLTREISDALPDHLGALDGSQLARLLDGLTAEALQLAVPLDTDRPADAEVPEALRLADGRSAYAAPAGRRYATPSHVRSERALRAATGPQDAPALTASAVDSFVGSLAESGIELGVDQAAAVRGVLTSGAAIESLVGPAGTGKSFVVGALAKAWQDPALWDGQARRVVGLASSQIATEVLAGEGLDASNIARWLGAQQRIAEGRAASGDEQWRLRAGDLIVVDESAMASTPDLSAVQQHASAAGAKLLLTGDHRQLAAVGPAGGMELVADTGASYELAEARRFSADWERATSLRLRAADESVLGEYHKHGQLIDGGTLEQAEDSAARAWLADTLQGLHSQLIVDTNEQAARLSAQLRADLVRLGKVDEHGVPLDLQGTYAGIGDIVQARLNGWNLAGHEGNRRGPINREKYRVLATREDGGLVVAPILGRGADGDQLGDRLTLPGEYVSRHVALGYASTVHSAQGLTVDTSHPVITQTTSPEALYVGMTRGRAANTAHVATLAVPVDAPTGAALESVYRSPAAVLASTMEAAQPERSALATAVESADDMASVRTPAELLADASELATAGRTAQWLDELVGQGHLDAHERARIAAEDGGPTLTRLLRRAELAGHDPHQVLDNAVIDRPLVGARQITYVLHHRITSAVSLDPQGDSYLDWTPTVDDPEWQRYLDRLADAADARRHELGRQALTDRPQWAVEALGAPPEDAQLQAEWATKAAIVAAHRELTGHDDPATALGAAPKPGQVEAYASWRAAWKALGYPEADRDELEMSDGQLHMRIRAYEREETWAPRFVANELAGTRHEAEQQRQTATLRAVEAAAATDAETRARLEREANDARELAKTLEQRAAELETVDEARAQWLTHTAETRAAAERARAELSARRADDEHDDEPVTAKEWLAEQKAAERAEDPHREITAEYELDDTSTDAPEHAADATDESPAAETEVTDVREVAESEPKQVDEDVVRTATAEETAEHVANAQRALAEIRAREQAERERAAEEARAEQLARWHTQDVAREQADDRGAALEMAVPGE
ncbi:relaxase domain-containing protein [Amycolatopsis sp. K13G38]|uniref:Relaxase domain-containing protein n=1 Tax=Amycolatopsis acididurans TaxID=2724524 RepID=A0ABX1J197_9PSEU|nr:relaxase domain-containing protein [Amycolatopsis acididurans]